MQKNSKYNQGPIINLDDIPSDEINQALNDFSEGSPGLKKCLSIMWKNKLKTLACCAGNKNSFEEAYILMEEDIDFFSYLSDELLLSNMVSIFCDQKNRQSIVFIGPEIYKEKYFNILANDILSGVKHNMKTLNDKIGKPLPQEWKVHGIVYQMMRDIIPTVGPIKRMKIMSLCKLLNKSTLEQQKTIIQECYKELALAQKDKESGKRR